MKTRLALFGTATLIGITLLAAGRAAGEELRVRVGATLPLTGALAFAGVDVRQGMVLAKEVLQSRPVSAGATPVTLDLVFEDNAHIGRNAVLSAEKLLRVDDVDALVSLWDMSDVVAPLVERKGIPHFAIRWDPGLSERYGTAFTVESSYRSYSESLLSLLAYSGARTASLLAEDAPGWVLARDYLLQTAFTHGIAIIDSETFIPQELDLRAIVTRALRSSPDAVILLSNPPHTEELIRRLRELNPRQRFTGYFETLQSPEFVDGVPFVAQFEVQQWFIDMFQRRFGHPPQSRAAQAFDIVMIIGEVAQHTGGRPAPEDITSHLHNATMEGAAGRLTITGERTIESACVWKVARDGAFVRLPPPVKPAMPLQSGAEGTLEKAQRRSQSRSLSRRDPDARTISSAEAQ